MEVLEEMRSRGVQILAIGERGVQFAFQSKLDEVLRNLLYLPVGQTLAFDHALLKGLNPDTQANLGAVVRLAD